MAFILPALFVFVCSAAAAQVRVEPMDVNDGQVAQWNAFVDALYQFHRERIDGREVQIGSRVGGYARYPDYYEEQTFTDAGSGNVLSRIRWERPEAEATAAQPVGPGVPEPGGRAIHSIEVFIYDDAGRVTRDYSASYLPVHRNAPLQTLVFLHHYPQGLHAFRAFDAGGNLIYEVCRGRIDDQAVHISLDEDAIHDARREPGGLASTPVYAACFEGLAESPGEHLLPG
jgi:hypothetical protein